ncbi:hypothetical protein PCE1_002994 [Barthelona sp. PCE]
MISESYLSTGTEHTSRLAKSIARSVYSALIHSFPEISGSHVSSSTRELQTNTDKQGLIDRNGTLSMISKSLLNVRFNPRLSNVFGLCRRILSLPVDEELPLPFSLIVVIARCFRDLTIDFQEILAELGTEACIQLLEIDIFLECLGIFPSFLLQDTDYVLFSYIMVFLSFLTIKDVSNPFKNDSLLIKILNDVFVAVRNPNFPNCLLASFSAVIQPIFAAELVELDQIDVSYQIECVTEPQIMFVLLSSVVSERTLGKLLSRVLSTSYDPTIPYTLISLALEKLEKLMYDAFKPHHCGIINGIQQLLQKFDDVTSAVFQSLLFFSYNLLSDVFYVGKFLEIGDFSLTNVSVVRNIVDTYLTLIDTFTTYQTADIFSIPHALISILPQLEFCDNDTYASYFVLYDRVASFVTKSETTENGRKMYGWLNKLLEFIVPDTEDRVTDLARLLIRLPLKPQAVGVILGAEGEDIEELRRSFFLSQPWFDFDKFTFCDVFEMYMTSFRPPKEGQQFDRIMLTFTQLCGERMGVPVADINTIVLATTLLHTTVYSGKRNLPYDRFRRGILFNVDDFLDDKGSLRNDLEELPLYHKLDAIVEQLYKRVTHREFVLPYYYSVDELPEVVDYYFSRNCLNPVVEAPYLKPDIDTSQFTGNYVLELLFKPINTITSVEYTSSLTPSNVLDLCGVLEALFEVFCNCSEEMLISSRSFREKVALNISRFIMNSVADELKRLALDMLNIDKYLFFVQDLSSFWLEFVDVMVYLNTNLNSTRKSFFRTTKKTETLEDEYQDLMTCSFVPQLSNDAFISLLKGLTVPNFQVNTLVFRLDLIFTVTRDYYIQSLEYRSKIVVVDCWTLIHKLFSYLNKLNRVHSVLLTYLLRFFELFLDSTILPDVLTTIAGLNGVESHEILSNFLHVMKSMEKCEPITHNVINAMTFTRFIGKQSPTIDDVRELNSDKHKYAMFFKSAVVLAERCNGELSPLFADFFLKYAIIFVSKLSEGGLNCDLFLKPEFLSLFPLKHFIQITEAMTAEAAPALLYGFDVLLRRDLSESEILIQDFFIFKLLEKIIGNTEERFGGCTIQQLNSIIRAASCVAILVVKEADNDSKFFEYYVSFLLQLRDRYTEPFALTTYVAEITNIFDAVKMYSSDSNDSFAKYLERLFLNQ